jgi:hypothetical protein
MNRAYAAARESCAINVLLNALATLQRTKFTGHIGHTSPSLGRSLLIRGHHEPQIALAVAYLGCDRIRIAWLASLREYVMRDLAVVENAAFRKRPHFAFAFEHELIAPVYERLRLPRLETLLDVLKVATANIGLVMRFRLHDPLHNA